MPDEITPMSGFFEEVQRRKVYRVAVAYVVAAGGIRSEMIRASNPCDKNSVRSFSVALIALVCGLTSAHAQWSIRSAKSEFSSGRSVEHRTIALATAETEATVELALFSPKTSTLRVINNPDQSDSLADAMEREKCVAGVNGGYFDPNYAPVGLMISDARVVMPQQKARLLSGVVSATRDRVLVQRAAEFSIKTKPTAARQCGPFLLDQGKPIVGLNDTRTARRTFVATLADGRAAIGYCSYVTLAQLAALLATPELKIQRAMNLDGGSSSGFWFAGENGVFQIREQKTVRDFIAIAPK
ncbi:MAG: phosphodiester glycosidase family protein [Verrucomicrobiota bacterium]|nr:phosphodiester glycosidase family protein [Verrucomicrobiota bacterium]